MRPIGCCTWIFAGEELPSIAMRARRAKLNGVELHGDMVGLDPALSGRLPTDAGLEVFSVTPGDADISHPDPMQRQAGVTYYARLIEWVVRLDHPRVRLSVHGQVGRIRPLADQTTEWEFLVESVQHIAAAAAKAGLSVVFELLNRYESHQVNTVAQGLSLIERVAAPNLSLLPDAYHMNIEEADPPAALRAAGRAIGLYHAADSNRQGIGEGHTDFAAHVAALDAIGYRGPIILEPATPGPDPFRADKGDGFRDRLEAMITASAARLRKIQEITQERASLPA